jgi:GT2 family glycosyltransferase/glycosyltransferase involved in cell wall biosynthesis
MRILFVVHGFPPASMGGTEVYASELAQTLRDRGHGVVVFAREARPDLPEYTVRSEDSNGVRVIRVNNTFRYARSYEDAYRNETIDAIAGTVLDEARPDVVHAHHLTCLSTGIVGECVSRRIPIVLTLNDYWLFCQRGQLLDLDLKRCPGPDPGRCATCAGLAASERPVVHRAARWFRAVERHAPARLAALQRRLATRVNRRAVPASAREEVARRLDHVRMVCDSASRLLAPSRTAIEQFVRFGVPRSRLQLQQMGIDVRAFSDLPRQDSDRLRLGFIGSLMVSKAPHVLLDAFAGLPHERVSLTIAGDVVPYHGDDSYASRLRPLLAAADVRWLGGVKHGQVPSILASLDVLVVPSVWIENAPLVIKEAFAAKVPVVASNLGGMAEMVPDGRCGLLFAPGDAADLRRVLMRLLDEEGLLERLREGIPPVRTMAADAAWTEGVYEEVCRDRASNPPRPMSVAGVVLNHHTADDTLLAVRSLQASRRPLDQIIVVDNGSDPACKQALAPWRDSVRFIRSAVNLGFAGGCNLGIDAALDASADAVLLVNSDAVLAPDTVERLEDALAATPGAGIAAPLIVSRSEPGIVASAGIRFSPRTGRMRQEGFGAPTADLWKRETQTVEAVSGCVMLIRRSVFDAAGLFDPRYFFSFEDIEFCWRARRAGWETLLVPSALAYHEGQRSIGSGSPSRLYFGSRNQLLAANAVAPVRGLASLARTTAIVLLNLGYAVRAPHVPPVAALRAVVRGALDHFRGRYGAGPVGP